MVSGLVTSPCDQLRIFSGEARLMRIASKSAIGFARSNGLERNKVSSTSRGLSLPPAAPYQLGQKPTRLPTRVALFATGWAFLTFNLADIGELIAISRFPSKLCNPLCLFLCSPGRWWLVFEVLEPPRTQSSTPRDHPR